MFSEWVAPTIAFLSFLGTWFQVYLQWKQGKPPMTADATTETNLNERTWNIPRSRVIWFLSFLAVWSVASLYILALHSAGSKIPATIITLDARPVRGQPPTPHMPFSVNVVATHRGPLTVVQDVTWDATVFVTTPLLENYELATFQEFKKNSHQSYPRDITAGEYQFKTFKTRPLTEDDINHFQMVRSSYT